MSTSVTVLGVSARGLWPSSASTALCGNKPSKAQLILHFRNTHSHVFWHSTIYINTYYHAIAILNSTETNNHNPTASCILQKHTFTATLLSYTLQKQTFTCPLHTALYRNIHSHAHCILHSTEPSIHMPTAYFTLQNQTLTWPLPSYILQKHPFTYQLPSCNLQKHTYIWTLLSCTLYKHKITFQLWFGTLQKNIFIWTLHITFYKNKHSHAHCIHHYTESKFTYPVHTALYKNTHSHAHCLLKSTETLTCPLLDCTIKRHKNTCLLHNIFCRKHIHRPVSYYNWQKYTFQSTLTFNIIHKHTLPSHCHTELYRNT